MTQAPTDPRTPALPNWVRPVTGVDAVYRPVKRNERSGRNCRNPYTVVSYNQTAFLTRGPIGDTSKIRTSRRRVKAKSAGSFFNPPSGDTVFTFRPAPGIRICRAEMVMARGQDGTSDYVHDGRTRVSTNPRGGTLRGASDRMTELVVTAARANRG